MKTIRRGTFETNSSSTHSITMCMESDYEKWKNGEVFYSESEGKFFTPEERKEIVRELVLIDKFEYKSGVDGADSTYTYKDVTVSWRDRKNLITEENLAEITNEEIEDYIDNCDDMYELPCTIDKYYEQEELETFKKTYTTPSGEKVVAFGMYGQNW